MSEITAENDAGIVLVDEKEDYLTSVRHDEDWAAQIPYELMETLAPNGEKDYISQHINAMSEEEALAIIHEALVFHDDDWNFPSEMRVRMQKLILGGKAYGDFYDRDLRIDAVMIRYSSPYPGVRAISEPVDDPTVPYETFRAYFLGVAWAVGGTFVNTFFNSRFPAINISSSVIQIVLYPCGKFLEFILPDWGFTFRGVRHTLNPGTWQFKEQMFATITFNIAIYTTNTYTSILVQKNELFYGEKFVNFGYQLWFTLFVQLIGMGFAGFLRRFGVYPVKAIWPNVLPTVAMNRALTKPEAKENINGWTISRYRFFLVVVVSSFLYYWIPGYLFQALSSFNWMTWIAPNNVTLAVVTGSHNGLGFNPWTTFDWNVATSSYQALAMPFFAVTTQYIGSLLGAFAILGIYYTNSSFTAYLPINSSSAFANDGKSYVVQNVVRNNKLDETLYQQYSPPFYSAGYLLTLGANFAFYPLWIIYIVGNQWRTVSNACVDFYKGLRYNRSNYDGAMDVHSRMMSRYPEVPDWWFLIIFAVALIMGATFVHHYPLDTPVWSIFLVFGVNLIFLIPLTVLVSTTGTNLALGGLLQVITGFALPNNPNAFLVTQALGSWALDGYSENYVQDQKMAHYAKLAPRAVFRSQIGTIIITCFVAVATQDFVMTSVPGLCTPEQGSKFTCAGDGYPLYANSLMWGLLGSQRLFNQVYPTLKYCFLIGFFISIFFLAGQKLGPVYLPPIKERLRLQLKPKTFAFLDRTVFWLIGSFMWVNPALILQGVQHWAPSNMSFKTPGLYLSIFFMYWLPRRYLAWWEKYVYVLSAAMTAGLAVSALVIFFATGLNPKNLTWWGNTVSNAGVDASGTGILPIPARGYFGPAKGTFP